MEENLGRNFIHHNYFWGIGVLVSGIITLVLGYFQNPSVTIEIDENGPESMTVIFASVAILAVIITLIAFWLLTRAIRATFANLRGKKGVLRYLIMEAMHLILLALLIILLIIYIVAAFKWQNANDQLGRYHRSDPGYREARAKYVPILNHSIYTCHKMETYAIIVVAFLFLPIISWGFLWHRVAKKSKQVQVPNIQIDDIDQFVQEISEITKRHIHDTERDDFKY